MMKMECQESHEHGGATCQMKCESCGNVEPMGEAPAGGEMPSGSGEAQM
ncbi:MAG: hypothetical protein Q8P35_00265 [Candidatus Yanofskybacteria bacterium]|nr:hypothetical protein [Candidatus Yanofskybacteria bacterium]